MAQYHKEGSGCCCFVWPEPWSPRAPCSVSICIYPASQPGCQSGLRIISSPDVTTRQSQPHSAPGLKGSPQTSPGWDNISLISPSWRNLQMASGGWLSDGRPGRYQAASQCHVWLLPKYKAAGERTEQVPSTSKPTTDQLSRVKCTPGSGTQF